MWLPRGRLGGAPRDICAVVAIDLISDGLMIGAGSTIGLALPAGDGK